MANNDREELNRMFGEASVHPDLAAALLNQKMRRYLLRKYQFSPLIRDKLLEMKNYDLLSTMASDLYTTYFN